MGPYRCVCLSVFVLLTDCHCLRAAVVLIQADEGWHAGGGTQALGQVGSSRVVRMHPVLRGHAVTREAAIPMGHLLYTKNKTSNLNVKWEKTNFFRFQGILHRYLDMHCETGW
ncbi:hypothetical protein ATANTOWER_027673 [Ataeniobius toweri]|uniref:Uncharacterized protein n=1 Tax=Ataeniobius toweri TaxID=208326 RepID=A0ABU7ASN2_9TELE|nr:hypothetical protein [Ataeniobius toweri]